MTRVRVRFAPSPTGYLHVGNARTAILNWLFARHSGGKMILRIEDTDVDRSTVQFEQALLDDLDWLGLDWDEGPDRGGKYGPYRQSERLPLYQEHARRLVHQGKAFYCYCSPQELQEKARRARQKGEDLHYDGQCYELSARQIQQFQREGRKPVIRFRIPPGEITFDDLIHGTVKLKGANISDFVILRSDGIATYNFAVVVDDALMKISHVIRGEDHLSNTPKQVLLFEALEYELPVFVHIPMILGDDRSKLSKRHGDNQIRDYREKGYLPEAMINFLSLLSWSSPTGEELLTRERLIGEFDFRRLSKAAAVFNREKLNWMNGWYLRHSDFSRVLELGIPFLENAGFDLSDREYTARCIRAVLDRVDYLAQLPRWCSIFFQESVTPENPGLLRNPGARKVLQQFYRELDSLTEWNQEAFLQMMKRVQKKTGIRGKDLWMPIRVALTGKEHGPELPIIAEILGMNKCKKFIRQSLH